MFPSGDSIDPANKWVWKISNFYRKHNMKVKSHDFRVTQATEYYRACKDIKQVSTLMNHSSTKVTERYIKLSKKEM